MPKQSPQDSTTLRRLTVLLLCAWLGMGQAVAGSMTLLGVGGPAAGGTPFSITQTATTSSTTTTAGVNTFSGLSIGAADTTRLVYITICHGPNAAPISLFTIGGVTAAQASGSAFTDGAGVAAEIWGAAVPTGTTATVQFTYGGAGDTRTVIGVYSVIGTGAAFSVAGGNNSASATSLSASVSIPAGGGAIAAVMTHSASSGSGTPTNLTLDTNNLVTGTSTSYIGKNTAGSGATTMGVSWTGATDAALTIATFSP